MRTNGDFFALPINGASGQLYIRPVRGYERFTQRVPRLVCHRYLFSNPVIRSHAVSSFAFDPFETSYLMTGAEDGEIRVRLFKIEILSNFYNILLKNFIISFGNYLRTELLHRTLHLFCPWRAIEERF